MEHKLGDATEDMEEWTLVHREHLYTTVFTDRINNIIPHHMDHMAGWDPEIIHMVSGTWLGGERTQRTAVCCCTGVRTGRR
jgi:hypothetical protein